MTQKTISAFILLMILAASFSLLSCAQGNSGGILKGTVTVGPIFPVERPGENRPVSDGVFKARQIIIYNAGRTIELQKLPLQQIDSSNKATYSVQLQPGVYIVDINHSGIDRSGEVPARVEIKTGEMVTLDINIDTGIR
jgi:hypothetical protein